ncbi:Rad52/Rad22 family DNA repair protein [Dyadobacter sp. CY261]|uniref:Rad52/Rad22 family DNA repair protein n=1 Tax=Dyadobacter sp. CY261 TaxID=2907203 RepID=UPI001F2451F2|nr:Rad52/Rad22 family DNA repair protein [Dyadobacter sp. CY261]MCF0075459.1 Rad52/Rad22 family DNA repair protein [Dyadobacter sp. CY261]
MSDIFKQLKDPFDPKLVSWRVGSTTQDKTKGQALAYIDARDVMKRLDEVVGPENWQDEYHYFGETAICRLSLYIPGTGGTAPTWITKSDGAGDTAVEAEKGRISDAFKRAAVKWGIGRYLYDLDAPWVQLDNKRIAKHEFAKLEAILNGVKPPDPKGIPGRMVDDPDIQQDMKDLGYDGKKVYDQLLGELHACDSTIAIGDWAQKNKEQRRTKGLPKVLYDDLLTQYYEQLAYHQDLENDLTGAALDIN